MRNFLWIISKVNICHSMCNVWKSTHETIKQMLNCALWLTQNQTFYTCQTGQIQSGQQMFVVSWNKIILLWYDFAKIIWAHELLPSYSFTGDLKECKKYSGGTYIKKYYYATHKVFCYKYNISRSCDSLSFVTFCHILLSFNIIFC